MLGISAHKPFSLIIVFFAQKLLILVMILLSVKKKDTSMKIYRSQLFSLLSIFFTFAHAENPVASSFNTRSISRDAARDLVGWTNYINKDSIPEVVYGAISITPEYNHTFHSHDITRTLFGDNLIGSGCEQHLHITGSQVANRSPQDLLADYFYLPTDFESTVQFTPVIDNTIIDFGFYLGLDAWVKGLYFALHAPFAHTRWDLNIDEDITDPGTNNSAPGYLTPNVLPRNQLLDSFTGFANGRTIPNTQQVAFEELNYAQMSAERLVKSRMGEVRTYVGWNFLVEPSYHVGFNGQIAWPTGLRPEGFYLFEPLVGNGHFWELGFGLNGHYDFWHSQDELSHCCFYIDCNVTHLFRTRQTRTFDLTRAGTLSRYMMAMEMISPAVNLRGANGMIPSAQFNNDILPVANMSTLAVDVSIAIQADIVLLFNATHRNWSFDFGYNYWGRSPDTITLRHNESFEEKTFVLKGDAHVFGYIPDSTTAIPLSATQNNATINSGKNLPATGTTNPVVITAAAQNPNIDFATPAQTNPTVGPGLNLLYAPDLTLVPTNFINTSVPPIFITRNDLDIAGAQTRGSSNKLFYHLSYTWSDKSEWQPYLGFGGEAEWAASTKKNCGPCEHHHAASCASQWGVWIKTGATF
jgi:hypothetical protein